MADQIRLQQDVAQTAYTMALAMWHESNPESPSVEDAEKFIAMVNRCAQALKGGLPDRQANAFL